MLFVVRWLLFVVCCLLVAVSCVVCLAWCVVRCVLPGDCRALVVVGCVLLVVRRLSRAVCRLLRADRC